MSKPTSLGSKLYNYRYLLGFIVVIGLAVYFRVSHLGDIPPGLSDGEAINANTALAIIHKTQSLNGLIHQGLGQTIAVIAMAASAKLNGTTAFALRLPIALLGTAGVAMTYVWVNSWFGRKTALIAALLVAITPWTVGLSRIAMPSVGATLIAPTVLWLTTIAIRTHRLYWQLAAGTALGLAVASISGVWLIIGLAIAIIPIQILRHKIDKKLVKSSSLILLAAVFIGLPLAGIRFLNKPVQLTQVSFRDFNSAASRVSQTLGMFNVHGDNDFHYNIGGTPELNLFVGLMFLVGILVCIMRINKARYRVLFGLFCALLIPAIMSATGTPNSILAIVTAPIVLTIAALGTVYMLDVWYSTFPINSAARTLGTVPIVLLLVMSIYQSHKQYFVAWAKSPEVYTAYNEKATALASYLNRTKFNGTRYVLASGTDSYTIKYLTDSKTPYTEISESQIATLPTGATPVEITFVTPQQNDIIALLKKRFPKAQLSQHYSEFNDNNQLFAVYRTKP